MFVPQVRSLAAYEPKLAAAPPPRLVPAPFPIVAPALAGNPVERARLAEELEQQPAHCQFVACALDSVVRRLWATTERLKRWCMHEAILDWRDAVQDGCLEDVLTEIRQALACASEERRDAEEQLLRTNGQLTQRSAKSGGGDK